MENFKLGGCVPKFCNIVTFLKYIEKLKKKKERERERDEKYFLKNN